VSHADQTVVLTYAELAERLGIEVASAKMRTMRNRWHRVRGNDGLTRVHVPVSALETTRPSQKANPETPPPPGPLVAELLRQITDMQTRHAAELERLQHEQAAALDQLRQEHGTAVTQLRQDHLAELERIGQAQRDLADAHQGEIARLTEAQRGTDAGHQAEIARLSDAHQTETARLDKLITELRRPWWSRMFGKA
jgi:hypothetical protein